jgi:DNA-binding MarR family transcriptional regulator
MTATRAEKMIKLPRWGKKVMQRKGAPVSDSMPKPTELAGSATQATEISSSAADGTALETYFLSAYRTLKVLETSGVLEEANVSIEEWIVLRVLEKNYGPVDLRELSKATGILPKELRQVISGLATRSLVNTSEEQPKQVTTSVSRSGLSVLAKTSIVFNTIAAESSRFNGRVFARCEAVSAHIQRTLHRMRQKRRASSAPVQSGDTTKSDLL